MTAAGTLRLLLAGLILALLAACVAQPRDDMALSNLKADLADLRDDDSLAPLAPQAITEAERAIRAAGEAGLDESEFQHRILIASKRLEIARSEALRARSEAELDDLRETRHALLLRASRLDVEQARLEAEQARLLSAATQEEIERTRRQAQQATEQMTEAERREARAREEAEQARKLAEAQAEEIELARQEADLASETADSLRRRLEYLELRETDRGVVITLGDVLFELGKADLQAGARNNLSDVVELLQSEPGKAIRIEGHTDNTGPAALNTRLSKQRAEAVRDALVSNGIEDSRITTVGMGEDFPIAGNDTEEGRARNRRVDVILLDD